MLKKPKNTAALILAAGSASRFGAPKQAAIWEGKSLLTWATQYAQEAGCAPIVVVSGAYPGVVSAQLDDNVLQVYHAGWEQGMLSSIQAGMEALRQLPEWEYTFLLTTDMPWFTAEWLETYLVHLSQHSAAFAREGKRTLVATAYPAGPGLPLLLPRDFLEMALSLPPEQKLRPLLKRYPNLVAVPAGRHTRDVDRPEDLL